MRKPSNHLLIPVETLNREFDGKLLLALMAAERGWRPVIGGRTTMHERLASMPRSVYLGKDARTSSKLMYSLLEKMGHSIACFDEEALVRFSDELFLMKFEPKTFARVRLLFAWGQDNAHLWQRSPHYKNQPIVNAGNPRIDMMRPELREYYKDEIDSLQRRFGRFVLINSNFALVNHFIPNLTRFAVSKDAAEEQVEHYREGMKAHKQRMFEAFRAMLPQLSAAVYPQQIVVRPHPSESPEPWRMAAAGLTNVHVVHEGSVVPWLAAAGALVHNGCTSAIEAAVLGTPTFAYRPFVSNEFDLQLPNDVSEQCFSLEALRSQVRDALAAPPAEPRIPSIQHNIVLSRLIASLDGDFSCTRILDALEQHRELLAPAPWATRWMWLKAYIRLQRRALVRAVRTRRKSSRSSKIYTAHKFPGIALSDVQDRIARFRSTLNRFDGLHARQVARDIFAIEPAEAG